MKEKRLSNAIIGILLAVSITIIIYIIHTQEVTNPKINQKTGKTTITVLAGQSTTDAGIEDLINEALREKFPEVQLEWECVDWGEQFNLQMQVRFAAGEIPDLIVGKAQDVYTYSTLGNLAPIPEECLKKIDEKALQAVTFDKTVYGLPYNTFYQGVIYNKKIFQQLQLEVPETQEDLKKLVEVLKANEVTPFASHFLESWQVGNMTMQFFANDVFLKDKDWGRRLREKEENFTNNSLMRNCLLQNQFILDNSWKDAYDIDQYESDIRFNEGKAAMYLTGSWWLQSVSSENAGDSFGIFPYPNLTGDSKLIRETNITFMKSNATKHRELVDEILKELVSNKELIRDILDFTQTYSVIEGVNPEYGYCIDPDVSRYEENRQVVEITADNNQLTWAYQNKIAAKQLEWLKGSYTLEEVLEYADRKRQESGN